MYAHPGTEGRLQQSCYCERVIFLEWLPAIHVLTLQDRSGTNNPWVSLAVRKNIPLIKKHLALATNTVFNPESTINLKIWILKFQCKKIIILHERLLAFLML